MKILPNENQIINSILKGNDPILETLREQYKLSEVILREYTGVGFYIQFKVSESPPNVKPNSFVIQDIHLEVKGTENGASAMLFIKNGVIDFLEIIATTGNLPEEFEGESIYYFKRKKANSFQELRASKERDLEVTRRVWLKSYV
jgi:hypothetical protein